ncbi:hypothetical protein [Cryobacterium sp. M23]|uniref:hypothetical protein n=1 Tax=Cryobacterium sp. M23 TaxID=2048292 RepID=UPI000CE4A1FC|nr:hypothetical protein [Cryobacterium sp. M23]
MNHTLHVAHGTSFGAVDPVPLEHGGDAHGVAPILSRRGKLSLSGIRHRDRLVHAPVFDTMHPQMEYAGGHA